MKTLSLFAIAVVWTGCPSQCNPTTTPSGDPWTSSGTWTTGSVDVDHSQTLGSLLTGVATTEEVGFDRVVFTFSGDVPSYRLGYVNEPVGCA